MKHARTALLALLIVSCAVEPDPASSPTTSLQNEADVITEIGRSGLLRLVPAMPDTPYRRCGTGAGEARWSTRFSSDHRRLAAHTNAGTVRLIDTDAWREIAELGHEIGQVDAHAFSPDGSLLATLSIEAGEVGLWSAETGTLTRAIKARARHTTYPYYGSGLLFSADGRYLVTSLSTIIDLQTDKVSSWAGGSTPPETVDDGFGVRSFSLVDGKPERLLVSHAEQATNMIGHEYLSLRQLGTTQLTHFVDHSYGYVPFAVSPDGSLLTIDSPIQERGGLKLIDLRGPKVIGNGGGGLLPLAFSRDQTELYTTTQNEIEVLAVPSMTTLRRFRWSFRPTFQGLSPTGLLVETSEQGTSFWDPKTGQRTRTLPIAISSLTWSEDGVLSAGASAGTLLHVFRESDGRELVRIARPQSTLPSFPRAATQPSGPDAWRYLVLARTADGAVVVRDVYAIHFGSTDWYSTRVEEVATKKLLREFPWTQGRGAEISPDGARLSTIERLWGSSSYVAIWCR